MTKVMTMALVIGWMSLGTDDASASQVAGDRSIRYISKQHGAAGEPIRVTGEDLLGRKVWVTFGNARVAPNATSNTQIQFRVPNLRPGRYTGTVWVNGERAAGSFTFRIEG